MKRVVVLGSGMIGSVIARDLSEEYNVTVVDKDSHKLNLLRENSSVRTIISDLNSGIKIQEIIIDYDLVICALPGFLGFKALKSIVSEGKNVVDISFSSEDPFQLDPIAIEKNVTAVVDCGISPGLSNLVLGYHNERMKISKYKCMIGGLPLKAETPFKYKAFFSPLDVIEEYTRPARIVENGKQLTKEAMTDSEMVKFENIGTLEAVNTDGLRSLLRTMEIPNMVEKTLRYPGHIELIKIFKEIGLFSNEEIEISGNRIKPIALTARLVFPFWKPEENEEDFTVLQFSIAGKEDGKNAEHVYTLFDKFNQETKTSSMARTTGFTCCAVARFILNGKYNRKGICPPEYLGVDENCYKNVLSYLKKKGISITHTETIA
ncbi:MAG: saccharopine dehydrogenase NADP-binding domain-containing protein [Ignavibacteria bacterium]|nr:saccharopine dehydrogenase NADP-binding domain-containing protein [Ignavibacteria bacterium]MBT8380722.1 saccharopine dehydrogenase NADP-binding domain-containing protein [Ignavibacteria bacterium]MBT8390475.1 saccharopine dehydrogenase NADP-binding domain-containing protein [Ignavibacteria bacterium]NNJ52915.1 saccharopine dehydrogenase [Ignavibacteriaceae bacterium]NNL20060.1 saccharopine dehydrogenase [Ignavibacteriaceae bacterium]